MIRHMLVSNLTRSISTYFVRGSITRLLISCLTGLDSTKQVNTKSLDDVTSLLNLTNGTSPYEVILHSLPIRLNDASTYYGSVSFDKNVLWHQCGPIPHSFSSPSEDGTSHDVKLLTMNYRIYYLPNHDYCISKLAKIFLNEPTSHTYRCLE